MKTKFNMMDFVEGWVPILVVFALIGLCIFALAVSVIKVINEEKDWRQFSEKHNCTLISKQEGSAFNALGIAPSGQVAIGVGFSAPVNGYKCDDGIIYFREQN